METEIKATMDDKDFSRLTVQEKKEIVRQRREAAMKMQGSWIIYDEEFVKKVLGVDKLSNRPVRTDKSL